MTKPHEPWKVLPHDPIEEVAENLWRVEGSLGWLPLRRVMTVVKRSDGGLVLHSPIALDEASMAKLDRWGRVSFLIVPSAYHRMDTPAFKRRYPEARVLCPRGVRAKVEKVVRVDGTYEDFPADPAVEIENLEGMAEQEGVMVVRSADGVTLVFNDAIFNMPHVGGVIGWVLRHVTASTGSFRVSREIKLLFIKDVAAFRAHLSRLGEIERLRRVIVSHHEMVQGDAAAAIRQAISTL